MHAVQLDRDAHETVSKALNKSSARHPGTGIVRIVSALQIAHDLAPLTRAYQTPGKKT